MTSHPSPLAPMQLRVALEHVAVGCNPSSNALSGNRAGAAGSGWCGAFGAKNGVALVAPDPRRPGLLRLERVLQHRQPSHEQTRITSVFLHAPPRGPGATARVLAGDAEGRVFLWRARIGPRDADDDDAWECRLLPPPAAVTTATKAVAAVTAIETRARWLYVASYSSGHVGVFEEPTVTTTPDEITLMTTLDLGVRSIFETLSGAVWPAPLSSGARDTAEEEEDVVVAAGGVDCKVHLFEIPHGMRELRSLVALEGHRGWIRAVDVVPDTLRGDGLLLASAAQDQRVRLWRVARQAEQSEATVSGFQAQGAHATYNVNFDALLIAHEDWVTSLVWMPATTGETPDAPSLVTSSMDNTIIVWTKHGTGSWRPSLRVGEHGGNGILSTIPLPSPGGLTLVALNFAGQLERWEQQPAPSKLFLPTVSLTGHNAPVTDLSWSTGGDYLLSTSTDQTTRVIAPFEDNASWHEISRAQVHGYDINCATFVAATMPGHNDRFVCGADEKILRVFEAPDSIRDLVHKMKTSSDKNSLAGANEVETTSEEVRVRHAYLPELSLTNKSADKDGKSKDGSLAALDAAKTLLIPVGDALARKTLWPEQRKLYGHGNELLCVASNHAGTLIASACKSREERFAAVWLWNTSDWSSVQVPLEGHKSSVVQLAFSPNDDFLVSVSKDRQFCVFERRQGAFVLADRVKAHKRIIWSCSWSPDSTIFVTGSRDQSFTFWARKESSSKWLPLGSPTTVESAVTAVSFAPWQFNDATTNSSRYLVAIGLENGHLQLYDLSMSDESTVCTKIAGCSSAVAPSATVSRLAWSPSSHCTNSLLACASSDHSVRVFRINVAHQP